MNNLNAPTQSNNTKSRSKIKKLPTFEEEKDLQKFLETNFTESLKQMIKVLVKTMVKSEMDEFRKQFEDKIYFNGYYGRNMTSTFGKIKDVPVPRFRQQVDDLNLKTMNVFNDEKGKFMKLIEEMHLMGISQRKIKRLARICFGIPISIDKVGEIHRELADREEVNINSQILDDDFEYLFLDGIWGKTKNYGWGNPNNKSVILCALAVRPNGERKIVGFHLSEKEDTVSWNKLISNLKKRGMEGKNLKLVIADDNPAIKCSMDYILPNTPLQNCIVHKMRDVLKKTKFKNKKEMASDLKIIFNSQTKEEATEKAKQVVKKWYLIEGKATESLRFNIEFCFTYFSFNKDIWHKIRTTNLLEREFREVRRRIKVFDNTFQNTESQNRYANTIFNYLNCNYPLKGGLHTNA